MTSRSLRKHQTTQSNKGPTLDADGVARRLTWNVAPPMPLRCRCGFRAVWVAGVLVAICVLPQAVWADETGRVTIGDTAATSRSLFQSLRNGTQPKPTASTAETESRNLLRALRNGKAANSDRTVAAPEQTVTPVAGETVKIAPIKTAAATPSKEATPVRPPVPPIPAATDFLSLKSVPAQPDQPSAGLGRLTQQLLRIQNVSAQAVVDNSEPPVAVEVPANESTGSNTAAADRPMIDAPPPLVYDVTSDVSVSNDVSVGTTSGNCCSPSMKSYRKSSGFTFFGWNRNTAARQMKKQAAKMKRQARRASRPFVEYYEPEDVDDYNMPILLVANEEEAIQQPEPQTSGLLARKLSHIKPTLDYAWGEVALEQLPDDFHQKLDNGPYVEKFAPRTVVQWAPTNLWYYPLYFEDPQLERYGHTHRPWLQPFVSSGRFMVQTVGLPYQMTLHPPTCREYALGYYQPGEWAPKKKYQVPWNEEAAATEFLWIMGLVLLVP